MSETFSPVPGSSQRRVLEKIGWTALIAVTLFVCYFSHLGAIGFVGPDEPRYAWIARDMAETGDWVTPRLYGKPWFEKPPLFYWGAAICFKLFGVSEAAARLPSAICALLATLAMAWLAWRLYGAETARWLLLLLPTTVGMIGFSHAAATDMPFSAMLTIAMVCAAVVLRLTPTPEETVGASHAPTGRIAAPTGAVLDTPGAVPTPSALPSPTGQSQAPVPVDSTPWLALVLFGFFLGLAVLAKGPAAIILCSGAVFFWALFTKRWRDAFRLLHPAAIVAFCVTALPWYILCARRNPEFFRVFIIEHNFKRYLTPEFQHIQPFWFYGPILLAAVLPWSVLFVWAAVTATIRLARLKRCSAAGALFASWSVSCLLFFSISQSKLPGYILPAIPPIGLLLSRGFAELVSERRKTFGGVTLVIGLALFAIAEFVGGLRIHAVRDSATILFGLLRVLLAITIPNVLIGLAFLVFKSRAFQTACLISATLVLTGSMISADRLLRDLQPIYWPQKDLALQLLAHHVPPERTFAYRAVTRSTRFVISFYLRQEVTDWTPSADTDAYVISGSMDCSRLRKEGFDCEDVALGSEAGRWSVSHIIPKASVSRPNGRGQPQ